jgi:D-glycerate 3-kinase
MSRVERTNQILAHILPSIAKHQELQEGGQHLPFILGLTGLQGSGKSTLATDIVNALNEHHGYRAIEISLDDFYLTHAERQSLQKREGNALLKVRGQPGTHDIGLATTVLSQFSNPVKNDKIFLPVFDKSLFDGDGDRAPRSQWRFLDPEPPIQVVIFEGWCVGFLPLSEDEVEAKWKEAKSQGAALGQSDSHKDGPIEQKFSTTTLADHKLDDLLFVNARLGEYCESFMGPQHVDYLVHLDTLDLANVYRWRMEQEHMLRKVKGRGMTDSQVADFGKSGGKSETKNGLTGLQYKVTCQRMNCILANFEKGSFVKT